MSRPETAEVRWKRLYAEHSKALPRVFGDPLLDGFGKPDPRLADESTRNIAFYALGYVQELGARVLRVCEDPQRSSADKRKACELLVNVSRDATLSVHFLSRRFQKVFQEIAEERTIFPCLFSAHSEDREAAGRFVLEDLGLGKSHPFKVRSARKTFSKKTPVNALLFHYIRRIDWWKVEMLRWRLSNPFLTADLPLFGVEQLQDLSEETAKLWLEAIWALLLMDYPSPEKNALLAPLGKRPSRVDRAGLKDPTGYIRSAIKEALGNYLVRMLRTQRKSADK